MFNLIKNGENFIALDVMIQMEYCEGMTLKDFIESRNRKIDRG